MCWITFITHKLPSLENSVRATQCGPGKGTASFLSLSKSAWPTSSGRMTDLGFYFGGLMVWDLGVLWVVKPTSPGFWEGLFSELLSQLPLIGDKVPVLSCVLLYHFLISISLFFHLGKDHCLVKLPGAPTWPNQLLVMLPFSSRWGLQVQLG